MPQDFKQGFKQEFDKAFDEMFARQHQGVRLHAGNAPGLWSELERLSKKVGLAETPRLYLTESYPSIRGGANAGGGALPFDMGGVVCVNKPALRALNSQNLHAAPSEELRAVLAHELSHVSEGYVGAHAARFLPILGLPVLAVAALALYDRAVRKMPADSSVSNDVAYAKAIDESLREAGQEKPVSLTEAKPGEEKILIKTDDTTHRQLLHAARYVAAGGAGLYAGAEMSRSHMLKSEYQADRMAVQLVGSADPMISALHKIRQDGRRAIIAYQQRPETLQTPWHKRQLQDLWHRFKAYTVDAHPTLAERVEAMRSFEARLQAGAVHALEQGAIRL